MSLYGDGSRTKLQITKEIGVGLMSEMKCDRSWKSWPTLLTERTELLVGFVLTRTRKLHGVTADVHIVLVLKYIVYLRLVIESVVTENKSNRCVLTSSTSARKFEYA